MIPMQTSRLMPQEAATLDPPQTSAGRAKPVRLAIVSTHPIQYYAPVFRSMAASGAVLPRVFYTWSQTAGGPVFDPGFRASFSWDVPLLEGYEYEFVPNVAKEPGSHHFWGIQNPGLIPAISRWEADAILVYGWRLRAHLDALRHFKRKVPVLFRGDSTLLSIGGPLRTLARRACLRWVYSHVDVGIAVGQNSRDYFEWCGLHADRVAFAPHSVDTRRFADGSGRFAERAHQWRSELGIPEESVAILFAAKFTPGKEPLLLLDSFLDLVTPAHLILVGNGEMETAMRERARGHAHVHFLPFQNQSDMPVVYRLGDVYALPSSGETWGLGLNEAMASGRALIASSRVGGARDLVHDAVTGWTFESGNRVDLGRVLRATIDKGRDELLAMGQRAQVMSEDWSTEAAAKAIAAAVVRACSGQACAVRRETRGEFRIGR
jgi:glycosyltransferase involved in cell wall biosynthesis